MSLNSKRLLISTFFGAALIFCAGLRAEERSTVADSYTDSKPDDLVAVETALQRDMSRNYNQFIQSKESAKKTYVEFLYEKYEGRRERGKIMAGFVAPILGAVTIGGVVGFYFKAKIENEECAAGGGDCILAGFEYDIAAIVVGIGGGTATLVNLIVGSILYASGKTRMRQLELYLPKNDKSTSQGHSLSASFSSPAGIPDAIGLNLTLSF